MLPRNQTNYIKLREALSKNWQAKDLENQQHRRWKRGDVYAPHDLSSVEMRKWKKKGRPTADAFDALDIHPMDQYKACLASVYRYEDHIKS